VKQRRNAHIVDCRSSSYVEDIAKQAEGGKLQSRALRLHITHQRPDEVQQHIVDIQDQQRSFVGGLVVAAQCIDLDQRLWVNRHVVISNLSSPKGSARSAAATRTGAMSLASQKAARVGSCAIRNCRTPARKPGS